MRTERSGYRPLLYYVLPMLKYDKLLVLSFYCIVAPPNCSFSEVIGCHRVYYQNQAEMHIGKLLGSLKLATGLIAQFGLMISDSSYTLNMSGGLRSYLLSVGGVGSSYFRFYENFLTDLLRLALMVILRP